MGERYVNLDIHAAALQKAAACYLSKRSGFLPVFSIIFRLYFDYISILEIAPQLQIINELSHSN